VSQVNEEDLKLAMTLIRDLRLRAYRLHLDPWAVRQALIIAFEIDTHVALERGVLKHQLETFDVLSRKNAREWVREQKF